MLIRWLADSDRDEAARIWRALEAEAGDGALACSWDWTETWLAHYGDLVDHRFAVGELDGRPRAVALVTARIRRRGPFGLRSVHIGTAGEPPGTSVFVEYNRVLAEPAARGPFAAALIAELGREPDWHELMLDGFAADEAAPFLAAEPLLVPDSMSAPVMDLRGLDPQAGDVLGGFRSKTRTKIRRSLKALGELETEWAETPEQALDILDELIDLHQARWTGLGEPGAFASPRFEGFHRELISRLVPKRAAMLFRVRADGETVGCLYGFIERGRLLYYQGGLAGYEDRQIRPIFVACALCMQACLERGIEAFDFMAGDGAHKRELSNATAELIWATARRPAMRWRLLDGLAATRRRLGRGQGE